MKKPSTMNSDFSYTHDVEKRSLKNLNQAVNCNAQLIIPKFENLNFFIQSFTIPQITISNVDTPYNGYQVNMTGDYITYGELNLDFLVDEDLQNYESLLNWITLQGHNDQHWDRTVDIFILWKTRHLNTFKKFTFKRAFVTELGSLSISHNNMEEDVLISSLTFSYQSMIIEAVN